MVERQRRWFGEDNNVMPFRKTPVCLPHQCSKNPFPSVSHNRFAEPAPYHDPDSRRPETGRTGNHVKESRRDAPAFTFDSIEVLFVFQE